MNGSSPVQSMGFLTLVVVLFVAACTPQKGEDEPVESAAINDIWKEFSVIRDNHEWHSWLSLVFPVRIRLKNIIGNLATPYLFLPFIEVLSYLA